VNEPSTHLTAQGPLTYGSVLRQALGMFRRHYARVAVVALVLFVPPPLLAAALETVRERLEVDAGLVRGLGYVISLVMVTMVRLFGPVVYAGYLDEAVGHEYYHGRFVSGREVLRTLPWVRLIAAEIILVIGFGIGLTLFVVPGIIVLTLFALVGPVIVQERHGVIDGFRRTYRLSRAAWPMILILVVALLAIESATHELVHETFHHSALWVQIAMSWLVAAVIGGIVGLVEVALATQLMTRTPLDRKTTD
jgi:hypothetical protein